MRHGVSNPQTPGTVALSPAQQQQLQQAVAGLSALQLAFASGYLAAMAELQQGGAVALPAAAAAVAASAGSVTILYGSQSGNAKKVAQTLKAEADAQGITAKVVSMADYKPKALKDEQLLVVVVATYGEGDPPDEAAELHAFIGSKRAPKLDGLSFAVFGLGDTSYEHFCKTGRDFDERLAALGATRLLERVDADVDFDAPAASWRASILDILKAKAGSGAATLSHTPVAAAVASSLYSKSNPFAANLITNQKLTGRWSVKDIRHIEIDLAGSDLSYQPGDALGVWFDNDGAMVDELLALTGLDGSSSVSVDGNSLSLRDALVRDYELTQLTPGFVKGYAEAGNIAALLELQADPAALRGYIGERQVIDVVREHPAKVSSEQLLAALRRLAPRLYSIASSQAEVGEEVHLTLAVVRYDAFGHEHLGGASGFLAERLAEGGEVRVFVEHNDSFRLPADDNTPIIMVGPGTGIAPFRAFMQERDARGASGDNWLFFGNPSFTEDFLYQVEWQGWKKSGLLTRIDLAWSRDQKEKIYVQQRLREQGAEVWAWLERGAHFYVCGDASRMAKDVQDALLEIIVSHGGKSQEDAEEYLNELRRAKRYQRDVY